MKKLLAFALSLLYLVPATADNDYLVGDLGMACTVSETGAAISTIPIDLPEGINGMQPSLSLVYNSQSGYGMAGWGWSLAGVSAIQRTGRTIYHDGITDGIHFDSNDRLALDGQRLMAYSGSYWANNSTYYTEQQSFRRVTYKSANNGSFEVLDKEGTTALYQQKQSCSGGILAWHLSRMTDANGNYVSYSYYTNTSKGYCHIARIDYTGSTSYAPFASVRFHYQPAPHERIYNVGESGTVYQDSILSQIDVFSNGSLIYSYQLEYHTGYANPCLTSVQKVAANGDSYEPTYISWEQPSVPSGSTANLSIALQDSIVIGDYNGDGRIDIYSYSTSGTASLYINKSANGVASFQSYSISTGTSKIYNVTSLDYDGDGKSDILVRAKYGSTNMFRCFKLVGTSFQMIEGASVTSTCGRAITGDFNGDGKDEFILPADGEMYGYGEETISFGITSTSSLPASLQSQLPRSYMYFDKNGNGKTDIFAPTTSYLYVFEYDSSTENFQSISSVSLSSLGISSFDYQKAEFGDFNGDGCVDFMYSSGNSSNPTYQLYLSRGNGFIQDRTFSGGHLYACDCNRDGLSEIFKYNGHSASNNSSVSIYYNTGDSFISSTCTLENFPSSSINVEAVRYWDIFGSGGAAFVGFQDRSHLYVKEMIPDQSLRVSSIQTSLNETHQFQYGYTSDARLYTQTPVMSYAEAHPLSRPMCVVASYESTPFTHYSYTYQNGIVHCSGKGFLGFRNLTVVDENSGIKTASAYSLSSDNYYLHPTSSTTTTLTGSAISTVTYTTSSKSYGNKIYWPYVSLMNKTDALTTLVTSTAYAYDLYGNETSRIVTTGSRQEMSYASYVSAGSSPYPNKPSKTWQRGKLNGETSADRCTYYAYDNLGRVTKCVSDSTTAALKLTTRYVYDGYGNVIRTTTSGSGQTRTATAMFSANGRFQTASVDELGMTTTYQYDPALGVLLKKTTPEGSTLYTYDSFGSLTSTTSNEGAVTSYTAGYVSSPASITYYVTESTTGQSPVTTYYNAAKMPVATKTIGFGGNAVYTVTGYNGNGTVDYISEPFFCTSLSQAVGQTFTIDNAEVREYDIYGRVWCVRSPAGTTLYAYEGLSTTVTTNSGALMTTLNSSGLVETTTVIDDGRITFEEPILLRYIPQQYNKSVTYTYYPTGQVKSISPQDGGTITLQYDACGNRTQMVDPAAGTVNSTFNAFGQLVTRSHCVRSSTPVVMTNSYETSTGRLLSSTTVGDSTLTKTYTYHTQYKDKVSKVQYDNTHYQSYYYTNRGRLSSSTYVADGTAVTSSDTYSSGVHTAHSYGSYFPEYYTYDNYGNEISERVTSETSWELLEQNARGQVVRERRSGIVTTYAYDDAGRLLSKVAPGIMSLHYTYDETNNIVSKTDSITNQSITYAYDNKNRLIRWTVKKNGIETPFTMTYDNAGTGDILAKSDLGDDASFSYEADTHALQEVDGVEADWGQIAVNLGYTDFGKVKTITRGNETYSIGYYPDNSRSHSVTKRNGTVSEERFYGDNYEIYRDSLGHSTYIAYLCHGAIVEYSGTTPTAFQGYYDAQGSLIALVDTEGNVVRRYAYDPWGRRVDPYDWTAEDDAQEAYHIARGYTMHEHLDDFELINMNGRIYDPYVAQFLSPDNYIQDPNNWMNYNRYAYCLDNPIAYTDPDGELWAEIGAALAGGLKNIWANRDHLQGFWEYAAAFGVGAACGLITYYAGLAGLSMFSQALIAGGTSAVSKITSNAIAQTGPNFNGGIDTNTLFNGVFASSVSGFASSLATQYLAKKDFSFKLPDKSILKDPQASAIAKDAAMSMIGKEVGNFYGDLVTNKNFSHAMDVAISGIWESACIGFASSLVNVLCKYLDDNY